MSIRLDDLLKQVPADTKDRVDRVRRQMGSILRDAIRQETGLLLQRRQEEKTGAQVGAESRSIPIQLEPGYPECLKAVSFPDEFWCALVLSRYRHALLATSCAAGPLQQMCKELLQRPQGVQLVHGRDHHILTVKSLVDELLARLEAADPLGQILQVNEDILGVYGYRVGRQLFETGEVTAQIKLYWAVIGLVAGMLGVAVEDLTTVVVAHELGHAYSHQGADIDNLRWDSAGFATSDHPLKEGLAQYYTHRVLQRQGLQFTCAKSVFDALAKKQPAAYRSHEPWVKDFKPEEVRFAMLESRRRGKATLSDFHAGLASAKKQLRGRLGE